MPKEKTLEEKLRFLQSQVRIGGKGTVRRKKKILHQTGATDDKKLQSALKKLNVNTIPGIEEVNIIKDDMSVIHFNNPKAQASIASNIFAISGHGENKKVVEMLPELLPQLGHDNVLQLRRFAHNISDEKTMNDITEDDDVPMLVEDFDEASKNENLTVKLNSSLQGTKSPENIDNIIKNQEFTSSFAQSLLEGTSEAIAKCANLIEITDKPEAVTADVVGIPQ